MNEITLESTTTLFKALADSNRLRILDILMQGDSCNCELNDRLGLPPNLLSHHLRILRKADFINSRRDAVDGRWIYYTVNQKTVTNWQQWVNEFFNPIRVQPRPQLCGPEGQQATMPDSIQEKAEP